jgi:hypothetical protein
VCVFFARPLERGVLRQTEAFALRGKASRAAGAPDTERVREEMPENETARTSLSTLATNEHTLEVDAEACDRSRSEDADQAVKVFKLSQSLQEKWLAADYAQKRQILSIVFLNFTLSNISLEYEMRKPFALLCEGLLVLSNRGDTKRFEPFIEAAAEPVLRVHMAHSL